MTWHTILTAVRSFAAPCCEADSPADSETTLFAFRGDAGFGLPLLSTLFSDDFFDISTAEPAPQPAEPLV